MIDYFISDTTTVVIFAILALSVNMQWGWTGMLNLTQISFVAIGAYMSGVVTLHHPQYASESYVLGLGLPFPIAVLVGMASAALLALLIGAVALRRLRPDFFAIFTLSVGLMLFQTISQETSLFDGQIGLLGLPQPFVGTLSSLTPRQYTIFYLGLCVVVLIAVYLLAERLYHSPFGRTLRSIREDETATSAFGRNIFTMKLKSFVLGAAIAGLGGALLAHFLGAFNPGAWSPGETFLLYVCVFVGGTANNKGVILGTFLVVGVLQEVTRFLPEIPGHPGGVSALRQVAIGLLIILILRFRPEGILREPVDRDPGPAGRAPSGAPVGSRVEGVGRGVA